MRVASYFVPALLFLLGGCAGTQLKYNTVDVADTVSSLYKDQVLSNLSRTIDNPSAIPSQVDLLQGTIQTVHAVTPTVTFPLTSTVMTAATRAATTAGAGGSLSASDTWQQNWNVVPLSDANTLRNLRVLYQHAVYGDALLHRYQPSRLVADGDLVPDEYYYRLPHCVICSRTKKITNLSLYENPSLVPGWLYWRGSAGQSERLPAAGVPVVSLGAYGAHELLMTQADFQAGVLEDFILFVLPNAEPPQKGADAGKPGTPNAIDRANPAAGRGSYRASPERNPGQPSGISQ